MTGTKNDDDNNAPSSNPINNPQVEQKGKQQASSTNTSLSSQLSKEQQKGLRRESVMEGAKGAARLIFGDDPKPFSTFVREGSAAVSTLSKAFGKEGLGKALGIGGAVGAGILDLREKIVEFNKATIESTFGTLGFADAISQSDEMFREFGEGAKQVQKLTGESLRTIGANYNSLYKETLNLAGGFEGTIDPATRASKAMMLLQEATVLSKMTGTDFSIIQQTMNNLLTKQGEAGERTVRTFAALSKGVANTGLSASTAIRQLSQLATQFEFLNFNATELANVLVDVAQTQKQMAEEGDRYAFKSPQQAIESYSRALQKASQDQKDFGQALFYSSVQGKGLTDALTYMFDKTSPQALSTNLEGLKQMFGGDLLTLEEARSTGREEEYMAQSMVAGQRLGLQSPQEYEAFIQAERTGSSLEEAYNQATEGRELTGDQALAEMNEGMKDFYPKVMSQDELRNKLLGNIAVSTGAMADSFIRSSMGTYQDIFSKSIESDESLREIKEIKSSLEEAYSLKEQTTQTPIMSQVKEQGVVQEVRPVDKRAIEQFTPPPTVRGSQQAPTTTSEVGRASLEPRSARTGPQEPQRILETKQAPTPTQQGMFADQNTFFSMKTSGPELKPLGSGTLYKKQLDWNQLEAQRLSRSLGAEEATKSRELELEATRTPSNRSPTEQNMQLPLETTKKMSEESSKPSIEDKARRTSSDIFNAQFDLFSSSTELFDTSVKDFSSTISSLASKLDEEPRPLQSSEKSLDIPLSSSSKEDGDLLQKPYSTQETSSMPQASIEQYSSGSYFDIDQPQGVDFNLFNDSIVQFGQNIEKLGSILDQQSTLQLPAQQAFANTKETNVIAQANISALEPTPTMANNSQAQQHNVNITLTLDGRALAEQTVKYMTGSLDQRYQSKDTAAKRVQRGVTS